MKGKSHIISTALRATLAVSALLLPHACESTLFIELEESDNLIVLNGAITSDSLVAVQVSRTRHILDNAPVAPMENALVRLYQGNTLLNELTYRDNGYYVSNDFIPSIGESYTITVENQGYPLVIASSEIPEPVMIQGIDTATVSIEYEDEYAYDYAQEMLQFDLTINDPPGVENYYLLFAGVDRSWTEYRDTTVKVVDSVYFNNQWNYFLEDSSYSYTIIHRDQGYPYIYSEDIIVEAITSQGVLFSDHLMDGKSYSLRGYFATYELASADSAIVDVRLHSISESYYKYLRSRQHHYDTKENYLAVPVVVYSNVDEGTGFFGGYSTDVYTITTFIPEYSYYWYDYY